MYLSAYKTIISIIALGCFLPIFALTEVIMADGSVVRGEMVSEGPDTIVMNIDGSNISLVRSRFRKSGPAKVNHPRQYLPSIHRKVPLTIPVMIRHQCR